MKAIKNEDQQTLSELLQAICIDLFFDHVSFKLALSQGPEAKLPVTVTDQQYTLEFG